MRSPGRLPRSGSTKLSKAQQPQQNASSESPLSASIVELLSKWLISIVDGFLRLASDCGLHAVAAAGRMAMRDCRYWLELRERLIISYSEPAAGGAGVSCEYSYRLPDLIVQRSRK
jgi:hypothetical protein